MTINVKANTDTSKWIHKMVETDSTITDLVYDSLGKLNQENIYTFNKQNRCIKEYYIFRCNCNECLLLATKTALSIKLYKWHKISDTLYVSKPFWRRTLIVNNSFPLSFIIEDGEIEKSVWKSGTKVEPSQ